MKRLLSASTALAGVATALHAGGVDRSGQPVDILFEDGDYAYLSFGIASPELSGVQTIAPSAFVPGALGGASGDMAETYRQVTFAYKHAFPNGLEAAIILDRPFGADIAYPDDQPYFAAGSTAELDSRAATGLLKYRFANNVSVFGGLRYQRLEAEAYIPFVTAPAGPYAGLPYEAEGESDSGLGYVAGIGYQIPEIALRVALSYNSRISHELETAETPFFDPAAGTSTASSTTDVDTPQSVTLQFETGIAPDTLLFGSARWVEWSEFDISPANYRALTRAIEPGGQSLVAYEKDTITYSLGLGHRFNESFAGAVTIGYEPEKNNFASNLGPTDGSISLTLGGTYTLGSVSVTAGASYIWIGNARTEAFGQPASEFEDNNAVGFGLEIGYDF